MGKDGNSDGKERMMSGTGQTTDDRKNFFFEEAGLHLQTRPA